jgi:hypothetical protein
MDSRNPYSAPAARLSDPAPRPGSPYKAVALGLLTDFGGTIALSMLVALAYGVALSRSGATPEEIEAASKAAATTESWTFYAIAIGGGFFSVLGGYVCARIARQSEYTLGAILAAINVVLGLVLGGGDSDVGTQIVLNAATIGCVMLGARLGKARNRQTRVAQS